jgi:hypothetical protein
MRHVLLWDNVRRPNFAKSILEMAKLRITTFEVPNLQFSHRGRRWKEMAVRQDRRRRQEAKKARQLRSEAGRGGTSIRRKKCVVQVPPRSSQSLSRALSALWRPIVK